MKNLFKLFAVVALMAQFVACSSGPDIVGSWKSSGMEIQNMDELMNEAIEMAMIPDTLSDSMKTVMTDSLKATFETTMNQVKESYAGGLFTITFKEDKTYETAVEGQTTKGTWSLSEDGKMLITKNEGSEKADSLNIDEITAEKLTVSGTQNNMKMKLMFSKAAAAEEKKE
jgi:DNA gyrase/topoisomerase IV subunit A